ncbi:hypothetical protein [uncultured Modestobacter sp.]|uniref:hypothetical protein n=1 Tax=uncultured Modestobacter sp. TaxID=380048 RepID=UPI00262413B8|nr:hypothetical protein [uncultured Modestobacter sp.]
MPKARALARALTPSPTQIAQADRSPHLPHIQAPERTTALRAFTPVQGHRLSASAREDLIGLVAATPFKTTGRDLDLIRSLTDLVTYDYNVTRVFDPAHALSEAVIKRWRKESLEARGVSPRSQGDYASQVRFVARHTGHAPHLSERIDAPRGVAGAPADKQAWGRVLDNAARLKQPLRTDVTMLADLTFGVGMRRDEVGRARRDDLYLLPHGEGRMRVTSQHGVARDVPIGPYVTERILRADREPEEFLVRPTKARQNLINRLFETVVKHAPHAKFDLIAARNRYIVDLLAQPIPFGVVCYLADLNPGGHTAQDLARFVTLPKPQDILEYVRGTWR